MSILPQSAKNINVQKLVKVKQIFPDFFIDNIEEAVTAELVKNPISSSIRPNQKVAVLVGSRGISNLSKVVKSTIDILISFGALPYIVPAMGSHGGGIAENQKNILEGYGITEKEMGVPIVSSMETVIIGHTKNGVPIHVDKSASLADAIVPIVRVKAHTDFDGPIESGLCKMLAIGLGKHNGCSRLHQEGFSCFPQLIPEVASIIIENLNIAFGVALIENAHENIHSIHGVLGKNFLSDEPKLLALSKSLMPKLQFDKIDLLIIEQIGKDISGAGMDPNIIGRTSIGKTKPFSGPDISRIFFLDISAGSHKNATGCGLADFMLKSTFEAVDWKATYTNCIASGNPEAGKIPLLVDNEEEGILAAIQTCPKIDPNNAKIVRIKDTLHLVDIEISQNMLELCSSAHFDISL